MDLKNKKVNNITEKTKEKYDINYNNYPLYNVKRGLRNDDGTGVLAGLTSVGEVRGYIIDDGERVPIEGRLRYRGVDVRKIVNACYNERRFGYEEVMFLLLYGYLPDKEALNEFYHVLGEMRNLPVSFTEDMIMKAPSKNIMNKLASAVLSMYSYDEEPDATDLNNLIRQSLEIIARLPAIISYAYQTKRHYYDNGSFILHSPRADYSTAENILHMIRPDSKFTRFEAEVLDLMLILHAEHGGGNNSAFVCRVASSTGTDTYSAIAAAIGSLKGPKHGGANQKVMAMMADIKKNVKDWSNDEEISNYLRRIINKEVGDKSGLVYGMGHAVYSLSDPRAVMLKTKAKELAIEKGCMKEFALYDAIERLTPDIFAEIKKNNKVICANVDLYSGLVYTMLDIPEDLFTPLFAVARCVGWCAHRIEEISNSKIIRPAYKNICHRVDYIPMSER
ncbi:MAG: citrate/2-methylcitrate synthase [Clostridia bacterium]|nr:citrate/2-methylcitrate synthase [Clostridia bacterium]